VILDTDINKDGMKEVLSQSNLINLFEGLPKWLINDIRNSRFISYYYKGVNLDEWELYED